MADNITSASNDAAHQAATNLDSVGTDKNEESVMCKVRKKWDHQPIKVRYCVIGVAVIIFLIIVVVCVYAAYLSSLSGPKTEYLSIRIQDGEGISIVSFDGQSVDIKTPKMGSFSSGVKTLYDFKKKFRVVSEVNTRVCFFNSLDLDVQSFEDFRHAVVDAAPQFHNLTGKQIDYVLWQADLAGPGNTPEEVFHAQHQHELECSVGVYRLKNPIRMTTLPPDPVSASPPPAHRFGGINEHSLSECLKSCFPRWDVNIDTKKLKMTTVTCVYYGNCLA